MKWCGFGSESPSGLHYTNRSGSPNCIVRWSSNRQCIKSTTNTNMGLPLL